MSLTESRNRRAITSSESVLRDLGALPGNGARGRGEDAVCAPAGAHAPAPRPASRSPGAAVRRGRAPRARWRARCRSCCRRHGHVREFPVLDHLRESRLVDEMIVPAVDFSGPRFARRVGHREAQIRFALHQRLHQAGFPAPEGAAMTYNRPCDESPVGGRRGVRRAASWAGYPNREPGERRRAGGTPPVPSDLGKTEVGLGNIQPFLG